MKQPLKDLRTTALVATRRDTETVRPRVFGLSLPARTRPFYRTMGLVYALGAGFLVSAGWHEGALLAGAFWGSVVGSVAFSMMQASVGPSMQRSLYQKQREVNVDRARRIDTLLKETEWPLNVEDIARRLQWTDTAVIEGLDLLVQQGIVHEDIHLETGEWTYARQNSPALRIQAAGSLDPLAMQIELAMQDLTEEDSAGQGVIPPRMREAPPASVPALTDDAAGADADADAEVDAEAQAAVETLRR
jgi:predicted transcriptional regulator